MFSSVALSRVAPVLFTDSDTNGKADGKKVAGVVESVRKMVRIVEGEGSSFTHNFALFLSSTDCIFFSVNSLLNIEMTTLSNPKPLTPLPSTSTSSTVSSMQMPPPFTALPPAPPPSQEAMVMLAKEMENMIIEGTIRQEAVFGAGRGAGLRGVVEDVLLRNRHLGVNDPLRRGRTLYGDHMGLKSPMAARVELPTSPRPSPPPRPQLLNRGTSYVRARSVSC
jgi:hypothetical protein